ncbi:hypothetical protein E2C01_036632 [Portunus trituberculatus]|uniref:Uncharacterized protein n=1 Tax=Portunus trituberculatus TaxID=210409 RepID=A0A5B7FBQ4_PORTR|nr:hypothetical protein [Portunus trituberculatus]
MQIIEDKGIAPTTLHVLATAIKHGSCRSFFNASEEASAKLVGNKLTTLHLCFSSPPPPSCLNV